MKSVTIPYLNQLELPAIELRNGAFIDKRLRNALHIYPSGKSYGVKLHFAFGASDFYIIRRWAHEEIPAEFQQYVIIGNAVESYTIVRCDLTHSVLQYIKSNLPIGSLTSRRIMYWSPSINTTKCSTTCVKTD